MGGRFRISCDDGVGEESEISGNDWVVGEASGDVGDDNQIHRLLRDNHGCLTESLER